MGSVKLFGMQLPLTEIGKKNPQWLLEEFVEVINQLLPDYLATDKSDQRLSEEVNPRLVRHYASQGLLDEPLKQGKYAVYSYRHLLQILVVRRLLSEGWSSGTIKQLTRQKSNQELETLLERGLSGEITSVNPALAYLESLAGYSNPMPPRIETKATTSQWLRLEIVPGLEIQIRSDFSWSSTLREQNWLKEQIWQALQHILTSRPEKL
jgi:DNA-binding transcriptional MerR regulator